MRKHSTNFEDFDFKTKEIIRFVGETMKLSEYRNIFSCYEKKYTLPKLVCYYVLYERGFSYPQIGKKFKRNHSSIIRGIKQAKKIPECFVLATIVLGKIKRKNDYKILIERYNKKTEEYKKIKGLMNSGMSESSICKEMGLPEELTKEIIVLIKKTCDIKEIPDYKNNTIKKIYVDRLNKLL